jgi:protein arginine N-methyltransferase 1
MRELLVRILAIIYKWVKSSPYLSRVYYDVANIQYFSNLQTQEVMLADNGRVDAYYHGILKHVKQGDVVVDLGTGTGILSFFASLKEPKKIYAIEHSKRIIKAAEAAAHHNGIRNIDFVNVNSKDFIAEEKVDVILHEQMGPFLFDENMVENVLDLRDRVLRKGGKILPSKFELFIEPVKIVEAKRVPFIWEQKVHNVSFECFRNLTREAGGLYGRRFITPDAVDYFLCEPKMALFIDLDTMRSIEEVPKQIHYVRTIVRDGRVDGFCVYFKVIFDEEIGFSTSPFGSTTSWGYLLLRVESKEYRTGDSIEFSLVIDNVTDGNTYRWSYK